MTPMPRSRARHDAGAAGVLGVAVLGFLLVAGLAGGVLLSTLHAPPVVGPQIHGSELLPFTCPADVAAGAPDGETRTCRRVEVANTGPAEGTGTCLLTNDGGGATARFADNQSFHRTFTLAPGETGDLLVTVDGTPAEQDAMGVGCGIPPAAA